MLGLLVDAGYQMVSCPEDADVILINTCAFIADAQEEAVNVILEMARYRTQDRRLVVAGCLAQRYPDELRQEIPEIDALVGTGQVGDIVNILEKMVAGEGGPASIGPPGYVPDGMVPRLVTTAPHTAYLKVAEGCNNACAYCIIPRLRGPYRSRAPKALIHEAGILVKKGVRELVLVAQDTTRYGCDLAGGWNLARLIRETAGIEGLQWLRLMYCYPNGITPALVETIAREPRVCRYLDIPMQHSSDTVLRRMGRPTRQQDLVRLVEGLRRDINGVTLRSTFMVGFPGESEEDFLELLAFLRAMRLERVGFFAYSREEGTRAADFPNQVPEAVKQERLARAQELQRAIMCETAEQCVGSVLTILTDGRRGPFHRGRTEGDAPGIDGRVYFAGRPWAEPGELVRVEITRAKGSDLVGRRVSEA